MQILESKCKNKLPSKLFQHLVHVLINEATIYIIGCVEIMAPCALQLFGFKVQIVILD